MKNSRDIVYTLASVGSFLIALVMLIFLVSAIPLPFLFRLGSAADKFNYVLTHTHTRWFFLNLAYVWTFANIPAGIGLLFLVKERNPARAYLGMPFWFAGVFMQFMTFSFMFSVVRRADRGLLDLAKFTALDRTSFIMELSGVLLLCLAMLIFATVLSREQGLKKIAGRSLAAISLACFTGSILIAISCFPPTPRIFYNLGMIFYEVIGVIMAIFSFTLLMLIFRKEQRGTGV